jgi:hypothetical protein
MSLGRSIVQTLRLGATMPSPNADDQHRCKRPEPGETEPALCPVHNGHGGSDLIREKASTNPNAGAPGLSTELAEEGPDFWRKLPLEFADLAR